MRSPAALPIEIIRSAQRGELQRVVKWLRKGGADAVGSFPTDVGEGPTAAQDTSPFTGAALENKYLFPNNSLRSMIRSFAEAGAAAAAAAAAEGGSRSGTEGVPLRGRRGVGRGGRGGRD